jgi:uncharacterized protein GlcG (DUF336 family)
MKKDNNSRWILRTIALTVAALFGALALTSSPALADLKTCDQINALLPNGAWSDVEDALNAVVDTDPSDGLDNGGFPLNQWVAVVDRDGLVCVVFFSGSDRDDQWPASRVIAMQKAHTANSLSLDGLALSTANLFAAVQNGGSLFGLQFSNPVDPATAYAGLPANFGMGTSDPANGERVGGMNVFGGGLALYNSSVVGGIGTSGNTSCADHIMTWKIRDMIELDNVPAGVADNGTTDNIIFDIKGSHNNFQSKSGFGHPECGFGETGIAKALPTTHPIGPNP